MPSARFDLHAHSTASDGMLSPRELVALAVDRGLAGVAITDHDTVAGVAEAQAMAQVLDVECIAGVELSCTSEHAGEVHLLGYFVDPRNEELLALLAQMDHQRMQRASDMVERVRAQTGKLTLDDVLVHSQGGPPGRPHIARAMVDVGILSDQAEAFEDRWLVPGGRAWVHRDATPVGEAIRVVHAAGGAAVFAHPGSRGRGVVREAAVRDAAACGLDGIEVDHPDHSDEVMRRCVELADELGLVQTGGSDDHGTGVDGPRLGCRTVSGRVVEALRTRAAEV